MGISGAGVRVARAAVFTALCVALSAGAHVLLSGEPLPVPTVAAVSVTVFTLAYLLAGRERRFRQIAALLLPLQLAADTVFTTGQAACYGSSGSAPVNVSPRFVGIDLLCAGGDFGTPLARFAAGADTAIHPAAPWLLLAVHLVIGLGAAGWLRGGEDALARLLRAAVAATFRPLLIAVAVCTTDAAGNPVATPPGDLPSPARPLPQLAHSVVRRGPPRLVLAA
ncbi:hypothetical protein PJ985_13865 [Streptomyces sp. ACA25]|uniref:hypothetical protein n=1 Tax=Streptomyces sp. ACA25 TaxID=3022596 RepID=UPI002306E14A|nr:hypothetical protein [Streptomyces sp. ACA25]MDB1088655.1 hypothetical protein [Streptomyces sp. ACA25]